MQISKEDLKNLLNIVHAVDSIEAPQCDDNKVKFKWDTETFNRLILFLMIKLDLFESPDAIMSTKGVLTRTFYLEHPNNILLKTTRSYKNDMTIEFTSAALKKKFLDMLAGERLNRDENFKTLN